MSTSDVRRLQNEISGHEQILHRLDQANTGLRELQDQDRSGHSVTRADVLAALHPDTAILNRMYLQEVEARRLKVVPEILDWTGYRVRVFLRHDRNFVFAIAFRNSVGMANHVVLRKATFEIDPVGRQQTLERRGPLPNGTTVHAWISGILHSAGNDAPDVSEDLEAVLYKPADGDCFLRADTRQTVHHSEMVHCLPGTSKVWIPKSSEFIHGDSE